VLTIHLSIVVFMPLAAGLIGLFTPPRVSRWLALLATFGVLGYALAMVIDSGFGSGLHYVTNDAWIDELGIRYTLGVDGLNLFLIALTAVLWVPATLLCFRRAAKDEIDRSRVFFLHLMLAETAVLGAFCAQDLALFVIFFDLMLVPFYFLIGMWGEGPNRVKATTKFVIYTLVGSLLMLAGAIALGVLATPEGGHISFNLQTLAHAHLPAGTQYWIFVLFAIAFLVKAPAFPLHGWMPDTYRATPLPVLALLGAVVSKVGVYGFLRIVLPILPDAAHHFQEIMIAIAVVSILYGSILAFSQSEARLVVGYSSIAQLGFITLGIFSLDPKGAQGAVMQMVTHGLVAATLFMIIGVLAARTKDGTENLERMGGVAFKAPVLASVLMIVTFATLAMPGSPNFIGEILVLFGTFEDKLVWGLLASVGVAFAAVYMIRFIQKAMHNRVSENVTFDKGDLCKLDFWTIVPLTAIVVGLGIYPQLLLHRTEKATTKQIAAARAIEHPPPPPQLPQGQIPPGAVPPGAQQVPPGAQQVPPGAQQVPPGAQVAPAPPQGGGAP
jgi:NADH-quinone oxidoreductase subunit M